VALAGPLIHGFLAVLFYFLWNSQISLFVSVIAFFMIFFNLGIMALNLIPVFPFDGGRILRAIIWVLLKRPILATKLAFRLGWSFSAGLLIWSVILIVQRDRLSLETAAATFVLSVLVAISLILQREWKWERPELRIHFHLPSIAIRSSAVCLFLLPLVAVTILLIPINEGLEAPGFTASVEPMIHLPEQYHHSSSGSFILTSVIPQAPILMGEWIYAQLDHSVSLEPEHEIVPTNTNAQTISVQNYQMLLDSDTTAIYVGLHMAGYPVDVNDGLVIGAILPQSPAVGILQNGDIITGANGKTVTTQSDLSTQLQLVTPGSIINLTIERNGQTMNISVVTMQPAQANGPARIGIVVEQHSTGFTLPFPIQIIPKKIVGGPSAGLMFTLGVYDLLTGQNLTGARRIAGTGTIDLEGNVGGIGGVQQKVVAAERAGAQYFLVPSANYADAQAVAKNITVVEVNTAQDAINFLNKLPPLKTSPQ
jgi:PDZ domain-containing protein